MKVLRTVFCVMAMFLAISVQGQEIIATDVYEKVDQSAVDTVDGELVYHKVDQMPEFPGGQQALFLFLAQNLQYPAECMDNSIQGKVIIKCVIKKDGSIGRIEVVRSVDPLLDKEAIRVVKLFPKFIPGRKDGKPVNVWYTMPIMFRLQ